MSAETVHLVPKNPLEDATDDGNAELFVRKFGNQVRFVPIKTG